MVFPRNRLPKGWTSSKYFGYKVYHLAGEELIQQVKLGRYEAKSVNIVREWHVGSAVGLDIGANIGLFSLQLLDLNSNPNATLLAFEANPLTFARLQLTIEENSLSRNIVAFPLAVSDKTDWMKFSAHSDVSNSGDGFLDTGRAGSSKTIFVHTTTLDDLKNVIDLNRISWMKIDVEGAELLVLRGGKDLLQSCRPKILFEIHRDNIKPYGIDVEDIFSFLVSIGYKLFDTNLCELSLDDLQLLVSENSGDGNYFALPD